MVTAQDDGKDALFHDVRDPTTDLVKRFLQVGRNDENVTDVDHVELLAQVHPVFETVRAEQVGSSPNALWPETGSGSIRRASVEGRAKDCHLGVLDLMDVLEERALEKRPGFSGEMR